MDFRQFKRFLMIGGVSVLALSSPAQATLQEALEAIDEQDFAFALQELHRLADKENDAEARYHLGRLYEQGAGVPKDELLALKIYQQSAEAGNGKAALKIGNAYYMGKGLDKNYGDAFKWYQIAAEQNSYAALYNIGLMYEEGLGVKKDAVKAFDAYKKSADQGYGPAQLALGRMYLKGVGTPQDFTAAVFWHKLAADQGDVKAQMDLANLYANTSIRGLPFNVTGAHVYYNLISAYGKSPYKEEAAAKRDELTQKMKNDEVQAAQMRAQKWRKKTREESRPDAVRNKTLLEEESGDLTSDLPREKKAEPEKQEEVSSKVTTKTDKEEMVVAAGISRRDLNKAVRENDFSTIVASLTAKANNGDQVSMLALGDLYVLGQGMESDLNKALSWYQKAAEKNNAIAFYKIGPMYCEGNPVEPDLAQCYKYFLLAKQYADADSLPAVEESLRILDENFEQSIKDAGKKLAEEWGKKPETAAAPAAVPAAEEKPAAKKKGLFSGIFKSSGGDEDEAMTKPEDEPQKAVKKEEAKEPKKEEKKAAPVDEDDLFSGL